MVTFEETVAHIAEIVEGREDFVYSPPVGNPGICANWVLVFDTDTQQYKREGSCIVGQLFEKLGVLDEVSETRSASTSTRESGLYFTNKAVAFLEVLQSRQDIGIPWGKSLMDAIERANNFYAPRD